MFTARDRPYSRARKGCPEYISNATFLEVEVIHDTIAHLKDIVETTFEYINKRYNASLNISPNIESDYFDILNKALTFSKTSKKSLAETDLMQDWNYEKNRDLDPRKLTLGMHVKVWWKCHVCGHEWVAMVYSRANGCGCNACFGRTCVTGVNDLQTLAPHLLVDWDYEKNELSPNQICAQSNKNIGGSVMCAAMNGNRLRLIDLTDAVAWYAVEKERQKVIVKE